MITVCLLLNVLLILLAETSADEDEANPGFYLKVAKNVPRLGRRSGNSLVPDATSNDERLPNWFERIVTTSKRDQHGSRGAAAYRKVMPFDPNLLLDLASSTGDGHGADDLKFVSWRDFDIALESDTELFAKLAQLAKDEAEMGANVHPMEFQQFVPLTNYGNSNGGRGRGTHYNDNMYYRFERSPKGPLAANKERVEYQM